jgi:hypothetical protein
VKNIKWKKPHDTFFAGIMLLPGEEGNFVTEEQLTAMRQVKMFQQCELLGHVVVTDADQAPALREDGPTLKEWVSKGNNPLSYPPRGFAPKGVEEFQAEQKAAMEAAEKAEATAKAKEKADAEEKAKADEKAKAEEDARLKAEADAKAAADAAGKPAEADQAKAEDANAAAKPAASGKSTAKPTK